MKNIKPPSIFVLLSLILLAACEAPSTAVPTITSATLPPLMGVIHTPTISQTTSQVETSTLPASATEPPAAQVTNTALVVSCSPTRSDALGPFYTPGAPVRDKVGEGYLLTGVVRSAADCGPIPGAQIEVWMAGPDGEYRDEYRATFYADSSGAYTFESHFPPPYSGRLSHHHLLVSAEGYQTLVTQHYPAAGQDRATFDLVLLPSK